MQLAIKNNVLHHEVSPALEALEVSVPEAFTLNR
jgi:hypothetical protein